MLIGGLIFAIVLAISIPLDFSQKESFIFLFLLFIPGVFIGAPIGAILWAISEKSYIPQFQALLAERVEAEKPRTAQQAQLRAVEEAKHRAEEEVATPPKKRLA